jgi:GNAT superfamily N-acetyltransferase
VRGAGAEAAGVREIDARTCPDTDLLAIHAIQQACLAEGEPRTPAAERLAFLRFPPATDERHHWLADGGCASLYVHRPAATFLTLCVLPERRRAGIGSALLGAAVARARERGVRAIRGDHSTKAGAAFARHVGATDGQRVVLSALELPGAELPEPLLPDGWRLATWLTRVPDDHLAAYVRARGAMDDAPSEDDFEFPTASAERVRAMEESLAERGREMGLTVSVAVDGEIGSFTELRVSPGSTRALTDDTGTLAAHRGKGLGRAVKIESLRRLRADHPEVDVVTTSNAEENAVMRHINESIGFRPVVTTTTATLTLRGRTVDR